MGRHSAPDDDVDALLDLDRPVDDLLVIEEPPADEAPTASRRGRHAASDDDPAPPKIRATNADLQLLRADSALRARVTAAVVVPFLLYTVALVVIGRSDVYLLWIWIPMVSAGVLAGALIDIAMRARERR